MTVLNHNSQPPAQQADGPAATPFAAAAQPMPAEVKALLTQARAGDERALATLYDRYAGFVYSVALRKLRDPAKAEDVVQKVFLKISTPSQKRQ